MGFTWELQWRHRLANDIRCDGDRPRDIVYDGILDVAHKTKESRVQTTMTTTTSGPRHVRAPRGTELSCLGWEQEAALRMLMNNLDPEGGRTPGRSRSSMAGTVAQRAPGKRSIAIVFERSSD